MVDRHLLARGVRDPLVLAAMAEVPRVTYEDLNAVEKKTSWEYKFVSRSHLQLTDAQLYALGRPDNPTFRDPPKPPGGP